MNHQPSPDAAPSGDNLLTASHLNFAFDRRPVLSDVSLNLQPGEVIALLGPNGSGKSTLLRTLLGILPAKGEILWRERPVHQWRRRDLARLVAYLAQSPVWDPEQTVMDVLRLGRAPYWRAFGIETAGDLSVIEDVIRMLDLEDIRFRPLAELSGGQRQRVFIGRALAQQPAALLLDEPDTFLDLRYQVELANLLRRLAKQSGIAVLLALHDLNLASAVADRLILLRDGQIEASGRPSDVLSPDILSKVYGIPIERIETGPGKPPIVLPYANLQPG